MKHRSIAITIIIGVFSLIPLSVADSIALYYSGKAWFFFWTPLMVLIPLVLDFLALKIGLFISRVRAKSFKKLFVSMLLIGYLADAITYLIFLGLYKSDSVYLDLAGFVPPDDILFSMNLLGILVSGVVIFVLDYLVLTRMFKFDKLCSEKISAMMAIITNMLLVGYIIMILFMTFVEPNAYTPTGHTYVTNEAICRSISCITSADCSEDLGCGSNGYCSGNTTVAQMVIPGHCEPA